MTQSNPDLAHDWAKNRISVKSLFIVFFYRASSWFAQHPQCLIRLAGIPVRILYKLAVEIVMGCELPDRVKSGPGLAVFHGMGLVVHSGTVLGCGVTLRQNTTIGAKHAHGAAPVIGNNVSVGANVVILGNITIGDNCEIGAGAIVVQNCAPGSVMIGHKAEVRSNEEYG